MIYLFDFDGTLVKELEIDYASIRKELCALYKTENKFCGMIDTINLLSESDEDIKDAFNIIDKYELLVNSINVNDNVIVFLKELNNNNIPIGIISRNGKKIIDRFLKENNLVDIINNKISCRDDAYKFLKPNELQLTLFKEKFNEYDSSKYTIIGDSIHDSNLAKNAKCNFIHVNLIDNIKNKLFLQDISNPILSPVSNIIYNRKVFGENVHRYNLIPGCNRGNAITNYAKRYCIGFGVDYGYGDFISYGVNNVEKIFYNSNGVDMGVVKYYIDTNKYRVVRDKNIDNLNFPDDLKELDYIFSAHALEHIKKWKETLFYWHGLLKPGGILFLYLPHESVAAWRPENTPHHVHKHTVEELKEYLLTISFKIIEYMIGCDSEGSFYIIAEK